MEKLLNKAEVAPLFGVTIKAVDKWVSEKKIPYIKISSRCVRFRPAAIQRYLITRTVKPEVRNTFKNKGYPGVQPSI
jgi:hypothetical protein